MKTLKEKVIYCLTKYEEARNCDIKLTNAVWYEFFQGLLFVNEYKQISVELNNIYKLPREDNIRRIRAVIQNEENRLLPTKPEVIKKRNIKQKEVLEFVRDEKAGRTTPSY